MPLLPPALAPEHCLVLEGCSLVLDGAGRELCCSRGAFDPTPPIGSLSLPVAKGAARCPGTVLQGCAIFVVLYSLCSLKSLNYVGKSVPRSIACAFNGS